MSAGASSLESPPLLVPYRAVGLVSDGVPFAVAQLGNQTFVTTAVGRSFQVYAEQKLRLAFSGPQLPRAITALCTEGELTVVASGTEAHVYRRADCLCVCDGEHTAPVRHLLMLGESTLITVCEAGVVIAWSLPAGEVVRRLHAGFTPTAICHPATYLNKVLLGGADGRLQLYNVRSGARVHEFAGWGSSVLCLEQSPALDVVGIGHADGRIVIQQIKLDRTVLELRHEENDAVNALAFRTDGEPILVSASSRGALHVWHLERRTRLTSMPLSHQNGGVAAAHFVRGQPLLISMGNGDNAIKVWAFDRSDGGGRLLRSRSGHSAPPSMVRFHSDSVISGGGPAGQAYLLSGGSDRTVRQSSIWSAQQDAEYSQGREETKHSMHVAKGSLERLLPPLTGLATSQVREQDWANVMTCHAASKHAYTWQTSRRALGPHTLTMSSGCAVTSVAISSCGNFGFLGGESGAIEKFNLQSGQRRGSTPPASGHTGAVRGMCPDALARSLFSGGYDGTLRTWKPSDLKPVGCLSAGAPIAFLRHQRDSVLLAAACDDVCLRIFDMAVGRLVRVLGGHTNTITDAAWSADGRWLISTALDATIRINDVPSGTTIGWYKLEDPPTSIAVSPQGEYIATCHASTCAICVWANRSFFSSALLTPAGDAPQRLEMPVACGVGGDDDEEEEDDEDDDGEMDGRRSRGDEESAEEAEESSEDEEEAAAAKALGDTDRPQLGKCITLSSLPIAHVRTLVHLETIQKRNLPSQPPTAPKAAPFFLPTLPGLAHGVFATPEDEAAAAEASLGREDKADAASAMAAAAEAALNGGGADWAGEDDDDEWAAAAAGADDEEEEADGTLSSGLGKGGATDGEAGEGGSRAAKRARRSRVLSMAGGDAMLSTLQRLLRAAGKAADASGWSSNERESDAAAGAEAEEARMARAYAASADEADGGEGGEEGGGERAAEAAATRDAYDAVTAHILSLSPSALDLELRSVGSGGAAGGTAEGDILDELRSALDYFTAQLLAGRTFEVLQATLCVFLRVQQDGLASTPALRVALKRLHRVQERSWGELRGALHRNLCLLSHLCRTQS